jgi:hypothetical protein
MKEDFAFLVYFFDAGMLQWRDVFSVLVEVEK